MKIEYSEMEIYSNEEEVVKNIKDTDAPPNKSDGAIKHSKEIATIKVKRHIIQLRKEK